MKILVLITTRENLIEFKSNINILKQYMNDLGEDYIVDYAGISCIDDFSNYEDILFFKYKVIDKSQQLSKIYNFISKNKEELDYDWYIKFRPEIKLLENINFNNLCDRSINARVRFYTGPIRLKNATCFGGVECTQCIMRKKKNKKYIKIGEYNEKETKIMLDDIIYIFNKNIIEMGCFIDKPNNKKRQCEAYHDIYWRQHNMNLNIMSLNAICIFEEKRGGIQWASGDLNL